LLNVPPSSPRWIWEQPHLVALQVFRQVPEKFRLRNPGGTSHISIIDRYGNALSMTTSVESAFGNGVMVEGFLLNNQLTDFSFVFEDEAGHPVTNRVQPHKRPRSSMSPTIVFDSDSRVALVTGSPGGARIIGYVAQSILNILTFGLDPQQAIQVPHFMNLNGRTDIEAPTPGKTLNYNADALAAALILRGHSNPKVPADERAVGIIDLTSGLAIIQVKFATEGRPVFLGGADPRRDGTAGGR
jgi:gamma-glutamyltranspeptidase / glutathione hydrolase